MRYVEQERIDKKLCIDCKCCVDSLRRPLCGMYRSKVDDSCDYDAFTARSRHHLCYGRFWELHPDICVAATKEQAKEITREIQIIEHMDYAKELVFWRKKPLISTGILEEAMQRAEQEQKFRYLCYEATREKSNG